MPDFQAICRADEIPEGEARMYPVGDLMIGVFHIDGEFYALDNHCPHAAASLAHGFIDDDIVTCRIHHWRFCIRSGKYLDNDQPHFNVRTFRVREVDGMIEVELS